MSSWYWFTNNTTPVHGKDLMRSVMETKKKILLNKTHKFKTYGFFKQEAKKTNINNWSTIEKNINKKKNLNTLVLYNMPCVNWEKNTCCLWWESKFSFNSTAMICLIKLQWHIIVSIIIIVRSLIRLRKYTFHIELRYVIIITICVGI